jgi:hypothetical protein
MQSPAASVEVEVQRSECSCEGSRTHPWNVVGSRFESMSVDIDVLVGALSTVHVAASLECSAPLPPDILRVLSSREVGQVRPSGRYSGSRSKVAQHTELALAAAVGAVPAHELEYAAIAWLF